MPTQSLKDSGWIEVICGSMFSGKTEELIRRLRRAEIAKQSVGTGETQEADDTPRTINLILNDEILATAILDLSQNNARLI